MAVNQEHVRRTLAHVHRDHMIALLGNFPIYSIPMPMGACDCRPPGPKGYFAVGILFFINLLNYADRFTLSAVLSEVEDKAQNGFHRQVDDKLGGLLQTSFIVSYMLLSPLFGYLGDRWTRKYIVGVGILVWSAFTLISSFSVNYAMLFVFRGLVGIGEASYSTVAPTIIADFFPVERRLRMLSIFYLAIPIGSGLGYGIGAGMSGLANIIFESNNYTVTHPFNDPWRYAFRFTPVLGVVSALLVFCFLREPERGKSDGHSTGKGVRGKHGVVAYLKDVLYCIRVPTFVLSTIGFTAVTFSTGAWAYWAPTYFYRLSHAVVPDGSVCTSQYSIFTASVAFGAVSIVAGLTGTLSGSELSKLIGRWSRKAECLVCALSLLGSVPFIFFGLVIAQYGNCMTAAWPVLFLAVYMLCLNWAPVSAILLYVIVPEKRATASAVQILLSHLFGDAASPFIIGWISDQVRETFPYPASPEAYSYGISVAMYTTAFVCVLGGGAFLLASLFVQRDRQRVEQGRVATRTTVQQEDADHESLHDSLYNEGAGDDKRLLDDRDTSS